MKENQFKTVPKNSHEHKIKSNDARFQNALE